MGSAIDYEYFITPQSRRRSQGLIRKTHDEFEAAMQAQGGAAEKKSYRMASGLPNPATFAIAELSVTLRDGRSVRVPPEDVEAAMQYTCSFGEPRLRAALKRLTLSAHRPPAWPDCDLVVTAGAMDAVARVIDMCVADGDAVLVAEPFYAGAKAALDAHAPDYLCVPQDAAGVVPEGLERVLRERAASGRPMPKLLYVNPTAANPSGATIPGERRRAIYRTCCAFNVLILEDDPYHQLAFAGRPPPSFLSLDTEGRVLRADTFSKVLGPGLRVGWLTGPRRLVRAVATHVDTSCLHVSTLSQVLVGAVLAAWGPDGLERHCGQLRAFYRAQCDHLLAAMEAHLGDACAWTPPAGGLYVWLRVEGVRDVAAMLRRRATPRRVSFVPGSAFMADSTAPCSFLRASFGLPPPADFGAAMRLLADLIAEERAGQE